MPLNCKKNKNFLKKIKKNKKSKKNKMYLTNMYIYGRLWESEEEKESRVSTLTLAQMSDYGLYEDNEAQGVFLCG